MGNTRRERQGIIFYHKIINYTGVLFCSISPVISMIFYLEKRDVLSSILLLALLILTSLCTLTPYIFFHRFKSDGIRFGEETFRWESISSIQKTDNELIIHSEKGVYAVLRTPFSFIKTEHTWNVMTDIYPPLKEKIII